MSKTGPAYLESLRVKREIVKSAETNIAIDFGCSLSKMIYPKEGAPDDGEYATFECATFSRECFEETLDWLLKQFTRLRNTNGDFKVHMMGVRAEENMDRIKEKLGDNVHFCTEFSTIPRGTSVFLQYCHAEDIGYDVEHVTEKLKEVTFPALFVLMGSAGVSYTVNADGTGQEIGGFAFVHGRTLLGLGSLLTGTSDYNELMELARQGDLTKLDSCIKDIFTSETQDTSYGVFSPDDPVFSFGEAVAKANEKDAKERYSREDLARGVLHLIMSVTMTMIESTALTGPYKRAYIGGNVIQHEVAREMLTQRRNIFHRGIELVFLKGGILGALGTMLTKQEEKLCAPKWVDEPTK